MDDQPIPPPPAVHPLEVFPLELWERVLDNLKGLPREIVNMSDTCTLFKDLLADKINGVWLVEVIPLVLKYLPNKNEILKCRLICKNVNAVVDGVLNNLCLLKPEQRLNFWKTPWDPPRPSSNYEVERFGGLRIEKSLVITNAQKWDLLREEVETYHLLDTGRSSILAKSLSLDLIRMPRSERQGFLVKSLEMLPLFQNTISSFDWKGVLEFEPNDPVHASSGYLNVRRMLVALPNLRKFKTVIEFSLSPSNTPFPDLEQAIIKNPLPEMKLLEHLVYSTVVVGLPFLKETFRRYGDQLTSLKMGINNYSAETFSFPRLTHLTIRRLDNDKYLTLFPNVKADKLVYLKLGFDELNLEDISRRLVPFLNNFPNLRSVVFTCQPCRGAGGSLTIPRDFEFLKEFQCPNVKHLKLSQLRMCMIPLSLYVNLFPRLETLTLDFADVNLPPVSTEHWMMVIFMADIYRIVNGRCYELGIWEELTSLKLLKVLCQGRMSGVQHCGVYAREEYERERGARGSQ